MSLDAIRSTIEQRIATELRQAPPYPIKWANAPFDPPNNAPWVDVSILYGDDAYATIASFNRQNGTLVVGIYSPVGAGAATALTLADRIKGLFDRVTVDGIIFSAANGPSIVTPSPEAYNQMQLVITFEAYQ
jgi:hypothetical protein